MIYQNTISFIGDIKRNILIGLLGTGSAIFIIDFHALSILDKRCKPFSRTIQKLSYTNA